MFGIWTTYWCQNYLYFKSVLNFAHKWVPAEKWGEISEVKGSQRPSCLNWNKKSPESGNWPTSNMSGNTTRTVLRVQCSETPFPGLSLNLKASVHSTIVKTILSQNCSFELLPKLQWVVTYPDGPHDRRISFRLGKPALNNWSRCKPGQGVPGISPQSVSVV